MRRTFHALLSLLFCLCICACLLPTGSADAAGSGSLDSAELVSCNLLDGHTFEYTVKITVASSLADKQYGIGVETSNSSDFTTGPERFLYTAQNTDRTGTCTDLTLTLQNYIAGLVPDIPYYIRAVLIDPDTQENVVTGQNVLSFTVPANTIPLIDMQLNQRALVSGTSDMDGKFTAPAAGFYAFHGDSNFNWIGLVNAGGWVIESIWQSDSGGQDLYAYFYAAAGQTVYLDGDTMADSYVEVVPAQAVMPQLIPGTSLAVDSFSPVCFTAPKDGYYSFAYLSGGSQYTIQQLDEQTGNWFNSPSVYGRNFSAGETVILRPIYEQGTAGQLSLLASEVIPPDHDSIEVGAAYSVTNRSMTLDFTLSVTADTADNGYCIGLIWGTDPTLTSGTSMSYFGRFNAVRNNETLTMTMDNYVPGQSFYYCAFLGPQQNGQGGQVLAKGTTIHHVQFNSSLNGFEPLTLDSLYSMTDIGRADFYFEAPGDGMYAVEAAGVNSISIKDNGGGPVVGESGKSSYLFGTYVKAGERIFITTAQNNGQSGGITVCNGTDRLSPAVLGTQSIQSNLPMYFVAPADGEYRFSLDRRTVLAVVTADGDTRVEGMYYHCAMNQDDMIWVLSRFNSSVTSVNVNLTIEQGVFPTSRLTFPSALTELHAQACAGMSIEEAVFGPDIARIDSKAFMGCLDLQKVIFPVADVDIADDAFVYCSSVLLVAPSGGTVEAYAQSHANVNFQAAR